MRERRDMQTSHDSSSTEAESLPRPSGADAMGSWMSAPGIGHDLRDNTRRAAGFSAYGRCQPDRPIRFGKVHASFDCRSVLRVCNRVRRTRGLLATNPSGGERRADSGRVSSGPPRSFITAARSTGVCGSVSTRPRRRPPRRSPRRVWRKRVSPSLELAVPLHGMEL